MKEQLPSNIPEKISSLIERIVYMLHKEQSNCKWKIQFKGTKKRRAGEVWLIFYCPLCETEISVLYNTYYKLVYEINYYYVPL